MWNEILDFVLNYRNCDIFLGCAIQATIMLYIVYIKEKKEIKLKNIYFNIGILSIIMFALYMFTTNYPRIIMVCTIFMYQIYYMFDIDFKKSLIYSVFVLMISIISEIFVVIIVIIGLKIQPEFINSYLAGGFILTSIVNLIALCLIKILGSRVNLFLNLHKKIQDKFIPVLLIINLTIILMLMNKGTQSILNSSFIIYYIFTLILVYMLISVILEKSKNNHILSSYDNLFEQLNSVKSLLEEYLKSNHEHKNDLINIKGMIKSDKKTTEYINCLLNENKESNHRWIVNITNVSSNGIKALLYDKIYKMNSDNINVNINISSRIKSYDFSKLSVNDYKDISRILAILLDNAYEASKNSVNPEVSIDMDYKNEELSLIISNTYSDKNPNIELFSLNNYSTKGLHRGYGLSILKSIVEKNKKIVETKEINDKYYYQFIHFKNKNSI